MTTTELVHTLTDATFDEAVAAAPPGVAVVVDFWADWCGPCHAVAPVLADIAAENPTTLQFFALDADAHPDTARRFGIMSLPTLLVFRDGELAKRLVGARGKQHLLAELAEVADSAG
jgi:thioredoxin 1